MMENVEEDEMMVHTYICRIFSDRYLDTNTDWIVEI